MWETEFRQRNLGKSERDGGYWMRHDTCLGDRVKVALGGGAELASQSKVQGVMWHRGSCP